MIFCEFKNIITIVSVSLITIVLARILDEQ